MSVESKGNETVEIYPTFTSNGMDFLKHVKKWSIEVYSKDREEI